MKLRKTIFLIACLVTLTNCGTSNDNNTTSDIVNTFSSNITTTSNNTNPLKPTTATPHTTSSTKSTNTTKVTTEVEEPWEEGRTLLDCGYYQMDLPKNYQNPYDLKTTLSADTSSWSNNDLTYYLPNGFRYIYRNACDDGPKYHKASEKFYQNDEGGLKIDNTGVGFQSLMFNHTGEKLEIRIGISQVNNSSDKYEKGKDPFHIYFFNKHGEYLDKYVVEEGTFDSKTKEIKFYWTNNANEIAYFEFRCNAMPYKGQQCYNVGIGYCNIKSWERA